MEDRQRHRELAGLISLGMLSDQMVLALGRVLRSKTLVTEDYDVLDRARSLFQLMTTQDVVVVGTQLGRMFCDESYLDALRVVRLQGGEDEIEGYATRSEQLLERLGEDPRATVREAQAEIESLRGFFGEMGEATLSRENELSRTRPESSWPPIQAAISRF